MKVIFFILRMSHFIILSSPPHLNADEITYRIRADTGYIFPKAVLKAYSLQNSVPVNYVDDTKGVGFTDPFYGFHWEPSGKIYGPFPNGLPTTELIAIYKTTPTTEAEMQGYMDSLPKTWQNSDGCVLVDFRVSPDELTI